MAYQLITATVDVGINFGINNKSIFGNLLDFFYWNTEYFFINSNDEQFLLDTYAWASLSSNIQIDLNGEPVASSSNNGIITAYTDGSGPFKYIKIYRITQ